MIPDRDLDNLYPPFAEQVARHQALAHAHGLNAHVFEGMRDVERQLELYSKGRVLKGGRWIIIHPELVVTRAFPGFGWHMYGVAVDWAFDGNPHKAGIQWNWEDADITKPGKQPLPWKALGMLGEGVGMEWYGNPAAPFHELPHFQNRYGFRVAHVYDIFQDGGLPSVWRAFDEVRRRLAA